MVVLAAAIALLAVAGVALVTGHPAALRAALLEALPSRRTPRTLVIEPPTASSARPGAPAKSSTPRMGPLVVVGLGDSVPSATTCDCSGYVETLGGHLGRATGRATVVHNDAVGGWTSADVEHDLAQGSTQADLLHADLVIVEVGANDLDLRRVDDPSCLPAATSGCWDDTVTDLRAALFRIVDAVRRSDANPALRVAVLGYWNVSVDGAVGRSLGNDYVAGSNDLTRLVNETVADVARQTGTVYVDAYTPFKGPAGLRDPTGDLLDDGDHPNASGHALLADAAYAALDSAGAVAAWTAR